MASRGLLCGGIINVVGTNGGKEKFLVTRRIMDRRTSRGVESVKLTRELDSVESLQGVNVFYVAFGRTWLGEGQRRREGKTLLIK